MHVDIHAEERAAVEGLQPIPSRESASLSDRVRSLRLPDQIPREKSLTAWVPWFICVALFLTNIFFVIRLFLVEPAEAKPDSSPQTPGDFRREGPIGRVALEAGGFVIPTRRVQVSPKVGGEVVELLIEEGQDVTKGDVLARLERTKYKFEYDRLNSLAEQAEELRNQLKDEDRRMKQSHTAASPEDRVRIESRLKQAEASYRHACAQRDNAQYDLDNTNIKAPITGKILVKRAEVGNTVRPEAFSNSLSASLCEMANLRDMEVDVDVSERDLDRVFINQLCEIRTERAPEKVYKGKVSKMMPEANRSKASVSVRVQIEVPEKDNILWPEMRARVSFLAK